MTVKTIISTHHIGSVFGGHHFGVASAANAWGLVVVDLLYERITAADTKLGPRFNHLAENANRGPIPVNS
jgi:hypothetical protein